ncbi:hypothetical protein MHH33_12390 [Paenisporosarcina sp. FSL H8-0542]|uniref:hypothetical protein n=1 Tax=unclassified Paenisporosarcina TaxID=2642018 RepID=UPI00034E9D22|nr:hypothetical protein [Paenisporosarcina sp. HGH0030]EPD51996.1 hypothetical protein HMPREF1210_01348 [Paenisporosarcina sp. HGH0030]
MKQTIRWCFALSILFLLSLMPITEAYAAPQLEVKATAGFQNKIKYGEGLPLTVTVVNSGDEFSGDLVIDYSESYGIGSAKAIPFTIGKGETKTLNLALPGLSEDMAYNSDYQMFYFYDGDWENGKEIPYKGNKSIRPNSFGQDTTFFLTLTESADRLRALSTVKMVGMGGSQIIHLGQMKDFQFPTDNAAYDLANYLVIDEYVLGDLEQEQQQAILDWVQTGGVVLVGASDNTSAELGLLSEKLPLTLTDERKTLKAEKLTVFANNKEFTEDIAIFGAKANEGSRVVMKSDNEPIAAINSIGKGAIIQTAFSLGDEPLSKQANYSFLLTELIKKANVNQIYQNYGGQNIKEQMTNEVGQMNELFPSFQVSTPLMITIVIIYIILVGPLLYFLLKRKDKREHAWWIIPAISILASLAIFAYGAKDRLVRPQIQQSSFYEVQADGSLSGYYVESLLSNRSGNFTFEAENGTTMVASKRMNPFADNSGNVQAMSILNEQADKDQLTVRDVGYWSVSSVLGESNIQEVGQFAIDLTVEGGNVRGTVKNEFPFALKDVAIWSGTKMINLGDLESNESIEVNEPVGSALLVPIAMSNGSQQYMGFGSAMKAADLPKERKNSLIRMSQMTGEQKTQPAIVAHTEDAIVPVSLKDARAEMSAINMIYQTFSPKTIFSGEFTLPSSAFDIAVNTEETSGYYNQMSESKFEWFMSNGSYSYEWTIPSNVPVKDVKWKELQLANTDTSSISVEIYNVATKAFEEVTSGRFSIKENIDQYISADGKIKFKVNKQASNGDDYTRLPELRLKGEVQK